jgi:hypothetical protein
MTDFDQDSDIHIRYMLAKIERGMRKIFTSNFPFHLTFIQDDKPFGTGPIARRVYVGDHCHEIHVTERTFAAVDSAARLQDAVSCCCCCGCGCGCRCVYLFLF